MGLLDDAIREHLELKRLRGADPGLVAREERDAFGPARGPEPADTGSDIDAPEHLTADPAYMGLPAIHDDDHVQTPPPGDSGGDFSNLGQETAELDMRTVLGEEPGDALAAAEDDRPEESVDNVLEEMPFLPRNNSPGQEEQL
jgi:hypothetical protein